MKEIRKGACEHRKFDPVTSNAGGAERRPFDSAEGGRLKLKKKEGGDLNVGTGKRGT